MNLSALSLTDPACSAHRARARTAIGADAGTPVIEVTETASISDMAPRAGFCPGARELGCASRSTTSAPASAPSTTSAPAVRLPEDRRRLHPRPARLGPDQLVVGRSSGSSAAGPAHDRRVRRRRRTLRCCALRGRLRAGLPRRRAGPRAPAAGSHRRSSRRLAGLRELAAHRRVPGTVAEQFARAQHHLRRGRDGHPRRRAARLIAFSIALATRSGGPPRRRIGPS